MLKKIITLGTLLSLLIPQMVFAQGTLLPQESEYFPSIEAQYNSKSPEEKKELKKEGITSACDYWLSKVLKFQNIPTKFKTSNSKIKNDILSCSIKTGRLALWMLPHFISYIANFFIGIAGMVSVLFVLLGGFWYMTGGLTDDKEKGKKTITYALIGLVITLMAWIIVNVIQVAVT